LRHGEKDVEIGYIAIDDKRLLSGGNPGIAGIITHFLRMKQANASCHSKQDKR
jgi:hypothetical protein